MSVCIFVICEQSFTLTEVEDEILRPKFIVRYFQWYICHALSIGGWKGRACYPRRIRERLGGSGCEPAFACSGFRSQRRSAGTNNNDLWQQSAHTVKETKSLLVVASGLTRLQCLARVSRALTHETGFRFQQGNRTAQKLGSLSYGTNSCLYTTLEAPEHEFRRSKRGRHDGSSREENGIGGLNQGAYAIGWVPRSAHMNSGLYDY